MRYCTRNKICEGNETLKTSQVSSSLRPERIFSVSFPSQPLFLCFTLEYIDIYILSAAALLPKVSKDGRATENTSDNSCC